MAAIEAYYGLSEADRDTLRQLVAWWRSFRKESLPITPRQQNLRWTVLGYATADIDAASGDITSGGGLTPGTGTLQPCNFDGTVWTSNGCALLTVYNISSSTVTAHVPIQCKKINGIWLIDFESCG